MVDSKENNKFDLGVKGLRSACQTLMLPSIINTRNFASFTDQFLNQNIENRNKRGLTF